MRDNLDCRQSQWTGRQQQEMHHQQLNDNDHVLNINGTICAIRIELDSFCWWPVNVDKSTRPKDRTGTNSPETAKRYRQHQQLQHQKRLDLSRILSVKIIPTGNESIRSNDANKTKGNDNDNIKQKENATRTTTTATTTTNESKLVVYYAKPNEHRSNIKLLKLKELTITSLGHKRQQSRQRQMQSEVNLKKDKNEFENDNINSDNEALNELYEKLQNSLEICRQVRPKRLLIFVNPFGGKGNALKLYKRRVRRLLELADIERKLIVTKYANHARETIEDPLFNVEYYDGIISVGGDGMFSELMNGLLFRYNRSKILSAELRKLECPPPTTTTISTTSDESTPDESSKVNQVISEWRKLLGGVGQRFLTPTIPLGMIGAGSTDANSFSFYGTNDVTTSTLNILLGNQIQIDICSVHSYESDRLLKFVSTFIAYGYFGDIIRESERLRWLGPSRYELTALNILLKMKTYKGLVRLLVSEGDGTPYDSDIWCHNNCHLCQMNKTSPASATSSTISSVEDSLAPQQKQLQSSSGTSIDANHGATVDESGLGSNESIIDATCESGSDKSISGCLDRQGQTSAAINHPAQSKRQQHDCDKIDDANKTYRKTTKNIFCNQSNSITMLDEHHDNNDKYELSKFRLIERNGAFTGVNAAITACRCPQTWKGFSPGNHLGNGCADLILVKPCSRVQYINYLLRTGVSKKSAFDLKYVDAFRCRQFEFVSADETRMIRQENTDHKSTSLSSSTESERSTKSNSGSNVLDMTSTSQMNGLDTKQSTGTIASTVSSTALSSSSSSNNVSGPQTTKASLTSGKRSSIGQFDEIGQLVDGCGKHRSHSRERRRECSSWNIDGEILEEQSIRVKVNKQLLSVFGTGEPQRTC